MDIALWSAAHLLVIGYWLGTDLAVYYLSGAIVDPSRPLPARLLATRAMLVLDMVPRTALILTAILLVCLALVAAWSSFYLAGNDDPAAETQMAAVPAVEDEMAADGLDDGDLAAEPAAEATAEL